MADPLVRSARSRDQGWFERLCLGVVVAAIVLVLLIQAKVFLIPLAVAILVFSLASAGIDSLLRLRLGRFAIPNWLASVVAVWLTAAVFMGLFGLASAQIDSVLATAPAYIERSQVAVARLFALFGEDIVQGLLGAFQDIDLNSYLRAAAGSAGNLLVATVLIILHVGFLFAERPWFGAKLGMLFPDPERARHVGSIVLSIRRRVHHYLLVKTAVSALTGLVVYLLLRLFGLDFAELLAILTFLLNFIPTLGSIVATILPVLVALVQFESLPGVVAVLAAVGTVQFVLGNVLDPMLMGRTLRMSSFAIVLSLTLWSAIWGVVGMFLAVPIMVMVMIVCAHIPALRPVAILLSRDGNPPSEGDGGLDAAA